MSIDFSETDRNGTPIDGRPAETGRRPWSTPTVIQSELSATSQFQTSSTDKSDHGVGYGS